MANASEVQALLRFLSQDAKVPLAAAMSRVKDLQSAELASPTAIAKSDSETLQKFFSDEKLAKQVLNAAKRVTKKRGTDASSLEPSAVKKARRSEADPLTPAEVETSLELREVQADEETLINTVVFTNRAPLVLAFAVVLLKYTMPEQPLSSRLSLAQAVVSLNSRTKAVSIGLESGKSAEEEGWGQGQPTVKIMGRGVRVMKRWGYEWKVDEVKAEKDDPEPARSATQETSQTIEDQQPEEPPLWGLDLEALKKSNAPSGARPNRGAGDQLPIYTAQSARAYLLKSFDSPPDGQADVSKRKHSAAAKEAEKERNLGLLLRALDLLYQSWAHVLDKAELDKRAWSWYVKVRPEVKQGVAGWGGKSNVKLADILALRRTA